MDSVCLQRKVGGVIKGGKWPEDLFAVAMAGAKGNSKCVGNSIGPNLIVKYQLVCKLYINHWR